MPDPVSVRNIMANSFVNEAVLTEQTNSREMAQSVLADHFVKESDEKKEQVQRTEETDEKLIKEEGQEKHKGGQHLSSQNSEHSVEDDDDTELTESDHFIDIVV